MKMTPRASIRLPPHAVKRKVSLHELVFLPSKLLEDGVRHQVDGNATVDKHHGDWLPVNVSPDVQWFQVLAQLFGLLKHGVLGAEIHLSDLLLNASELGRQREHHVDVHAGRWWRPVLDQRSLVVIQQVHVIIGGCGCRGVDLLLHPPLLLHRDHWSDDVEVLVSFLLGCLFPHLLLPRPLGSHSPFARLTFPIIKCLQF
jgi:hypothetical protein